MVYDWPDLAGIREQILANVSIAFPLVASDDAVPDDHANGNNYNLIVHRRGDNEYQANVVYGPTNTNKVFILGDVAGSDKAALLGVLDATYALIEFLYKEKQLPAAREWKEGRDMGPMIYSYVGGKVYVPKPET